jgi:hypothetical protein
MTASELSILRFFRRFQVGPAEMLFLTSTDCKLGASSFQPAMRSLIEKGMVVEERPEQAYSLTVEGYRMSRTASKKQPSAARRSRRKVLQRK